MSDVFDIVMKRILAEGDGTTTYDTLNLVAAVLEDIAEAYPWGDDFPVDGLEQAAEELRKVQLTTDRCI